MKKVLPTVAVAGGLYYYDQNVNPIISRNFMPKEFPEPSGTATPPAFQIQKGPEVSKSGISKELEQKYNQLESKTSELTNKFTSSFNDKKEDIKKELPTEDKNVVRSSMKSYYDSVNDLGDWLLGKSKSEPEKEADKWFNWGKKQEKEVKSTFETEKEKALNQYESAKSNLDELTNSIKEYNPFKSQKEEEDFLKSAQTDFNNSLKNLTSYGSELVDQANKNLEDSKNKWFNWGSKQQDKINEDIEKQKSFATQQYELAKRKYNHLVEQIQTSHPFQTKKEEEDHLKKAQDDMTNAMTNLKKFGEGVVEQIDKDYYQPLKEKVTK